MIIQSGSYYMDGAGCLIGPMVRKKGCLTIGESYPYFMSGYDIGYSTSGAAQSSTRKNDLVREVKDDEREGLPVTTEQAKEYATVTAVGYEVIPKIEPVEKVIPAAGKPADSVAHPAHYGGKDNPYETIKVMKARLTPEEYVGALKFNVYKYNDRAGKKGSTLEDHLKAQFYQDELVNFLRSRNAD